MNRGTRIVVAVLATLILFQVFKAIMAEGPAAFASIASGVLVWLVLPKRVKPEVDTAEDETENSEEADV
jgi:hypothetical protein